MIKIQTKLSDLDVKEKIDYNQLYVNFVDKIVFYKNEVMTLDLFKQKYEVKDGELSKV